jgi:AraC family transcriptional regulator, regulatory protein of adaptative response / DNA-3-methyladenine glycosylase II
MELDDGQRYEALRARDSRFDGLFFVGVRSTGIYCRPVCTARTPRRDRCMFFLSSVAAEREGYRACFVCRPELAPTGDATTVSTLVARALSAIEDGALDEGSVEDLAVRLSVTSRTLHRAFAREVFASPLEIAETRRLATAKRLLHDTSLSMIEIGLASGFSSLRRFNSSFATRFGMPPSRLRRSRVREAVDVQGATFRMRIDARPPFRAQEIVAFLGSRSLAGVEAVTASSYSRMLRIGSTAGAFSARPFGERSVEADVSANLLPHAAKVARTLRRLFDTDARPDVIDAHLASEPVLASLVAKRPGLRVPGAVDAFETCARAVLGQRVSVASARTLLARLVARAGEDVQDAPFGLTRLFPSASSVAALGEEGVASLGVPLLRARALVEVARAVHEGRIGPSAREAHAALLAIAGIGPFTAGYVAMRAFADPDAFPEGDLVLGRAFGETRPLALARRVESLRPFRAYAALHVYTAAREGDL